MTYSFLFFLMGLYVEECVEGTVGNEESENRPMIFFSFFFFFQSRTNFFFYFANFFFIFSFFCQFLNIFNPMLIQQSQFLF